MQQIESALTVDLAELLAVVPPFEHLVVTPSAESEARIHGEQAVLLSNITSESLLAVNVELVRTSVGVGGSAESALGQEEGELGVGVLAEVGGRVLVKVSGGSEDVERLCKMNSKSII